MEIGVLEGRQKISELRDENYQLKLKISVLEKRAGLASGSSGANATAKLLEAEKALEKERKSVRQLRQDLENAESDYTARRDRDIERIKVYYQRQVDEFLSKQSAQQTQSAKGSSESTGGANALASAKLQISRLAASNAQLERDNHKLQSEISNSTLRDELGTMEARLLAAQNAQHEAESKLYAAELRMEEKRRENTNLADKVSHLKRELATLSQELGRAREDRNELQAEKTRLENSAWAPPQVQVAEQEAIAQKALTRALVAETNVQSVQSELRALQVEHELVQSQLRMAQGDNDRKKRKGIDGELREQKYRTAQLERQKTELVNKYARDQLAMQTLRRRNEELEKTVMQLPNADSVALARQLREAQTQLQVNAQRHERSMTELQDLASQQQQMAVERLQADHRTQMQSLSQRLGLAE